MTSERRTLRCGRTSILLVAFNGSVPKGRHCPSVRKKFLALCTRPSGPPFRRYRHAYLMCFLWIPRRLGLLTTFPLPVLASAEPVWSCGREDERNASKRSKRDSVYALEREVDMIYRWNQIGQLPQRRASTVPSHINTPRIIQLLLPVISDSRFLITVKCNAIEANIFPLKSSLLW